MKTIMVKLILLSCVTLLNIQSAMSLEILWWNIGGGNFLNDSQFNKYKKDPLEDGLLSIIEKKKPDVIILGENYSDFLNQSVRDDILGIYPFQRHFEYNSVTRLGITVISKTPFKFVYKKDGLTWNEGSLKENFSANSPIKKYWVRSFQEIILDHKGKKIHLAPIHTMMPWLIKKNDDEGLSYFGSSVGGSLEVAYNLLFSTDNELAFQARKFSAYLGWVRKKSTLDAKWVVLGDFNIPSSWRGLSSNLFKIFQGDLSLAKRTGDYNYSYPYPGTSDSNIKMQIDHVMSNLKDGEITYQFLNKSGSDHFPMLVHLNL